jgi:hypothetical protein
MGELDVVDFAESLIAALSLEPRLAIASLHARRDKIPTDWHWWETWEASHACVWTVAKAMQADVLQALRDAVQQQFGAEGYYGGRGMPREEIIRRVTPALQRLGWWGRVETDQGAGQLGSPYRLRTILDTNASVAYARGRWDAAMANKTERPYAQYIAVMDSATRPSHAALHGRALMIVGPPNGFNCRCRLRWLSQRRLDTEGLTPEPSGNNRISWESVNIGKDRSGAPINMLRAVYKYGKGDGDVFKVDPGWSYNPGATKCGRSPGIQKRQAARRDTDLNRASANAQALTNENLKFIDIPETVDQHLVDQFKALGRERLSEVLGLVAPDNMSLQKGSTVASHIDPSHEWMLSNNLSEWVRGKIFERLSAVRPVGTVTAHMIDTDQAAADVVRRASGKYPALWVSAGNKKPIKVVISAERGKYVGYESPPLIITSDSSTAEHEYAHHLQASMPRMQMVFQTEHRRRTRDDPQEMIFPELSNNDVGRPDKYFNRYVGREYSFLDLPLEIMSMVYQAILGRDKKSLKYFKDMLLKDQETCHLALGLLFHYQPSI